MTELKAPEPAPQPAPALARLVVPQWVDPALRVLGFVVALLLAGVSALFEALYAPLYWGQTRVPAALLAAVVGNVALVWFTFAVTGRRIAAVAPALLWTAVMVAAASRTTEGDLVLTSNNWVGLTTMIAGSAAFGVAGYRLILAGARPPRSGPDRPE